MNPYRVLLAFWLLAGLCLQGCGDALAATTNHWKLDDNAASTTVVATVGTNAALLGGDNTSVKNSAGSGGQIVSAFNLNGSDDTVDISGAAISIAAGSALSFVCWFNLDSLTNAHILGRNADANFRIILASATSVRVRCGAVNTDFTVPTVSTGVWYCLLVTKTAGNSWRVFLNAVESSTGGQSNTGTFDPDRLGCSQGVNFMDGRLAWVKTFNSDESANVATLYAEGNGRLLLRLMLETSAITPPKSRRVPSGNYEVWSLAG